MPQPASPQIPEIFLQSCAVPVEAQGSLPSDILANHAENMRRFAVCRVRHQNLVNAIKLRENEE